MTKPNRKQAPRNTLVVAMIVRNKTQIMRDRRDRRPGDAKRSWKREEWL